MRRPLFLSILALFVLQVAAAQDTGVDYHASLRTRLELWNWFQGDANNSYGFLGNRYRFSISQQRDKADWTIEFAVPFILGAPDDAAAPPPQGGLGLGAIYFAANKHSRNSAVLFPKQVFVRFKDFGTSGQSLKLGRFDFNEGLEGKPKNPAIAVLKKTRISQRLIGSFGWSHAGRSYNGFHYSLDKPETNLTFAGAIPSRGVFQMDGWGFVKAAFVYAAATKDFASGAHSGELRGFGIYYQDWRRIGKTDNRPGAIRGQDRANVRIWTFGGDYIHTIQTAAGMFDGLVWGAWQTGDWGALDQRASAVAAEAGFQPKMPGRLKPWIRGGYFQSTGDGDSTDQRHETFFQIMPTPRIYARFPFFNLMNLNDIFGELVLRPHARLLVRADVHGLRLSDRNDLWYAGGGAFNPWVFGYAGQPSLGGRGLATFWDVSADVKATTHLTVTGYYGYANGKSVMQNIYPNGKNAQFGYLEMVYKF